MDNINNCNNFFENLGLQNKSCASFSQKPFKSLLSLGKLNYGDCSLTVECETVALETRVRLPPFAFDSAKGVFLNKNSRRLTW